MAAMGMSQSDNGFVNQAVLNHYAARAKGAVYAALYRLPIVIINVIISGGSKNGPSMIVSPVLCAVFIAAMAIRTAKKKS